LALPWIQLVLLLQARLQVLTFSCFAFFVFERVLVEFFRSVFCATLWLSFFLKLLALLIFFHALFSFSVLQQKVIWPLYLANPSTSVLLSVVFLVLFFSFPLMLFFLLPFLFPLVLFL